MRAYECDMCMDASPSERIKHLVQTLWWRHGSLDRQATHVLPALLQQRDEVVDRKHDVSDELILSHLHISNRDTHAQHLLQLELDGRLNFGDLLAEIVGVGDWCWEFAGCGRILATVNGVMVLIESEILTLRKTWT